MKFDKEAAQEQLDQASIELEKAGFADLAEKVDYYSDRLMKASVHEVPLVKRALHRIQQEAKVRLQEISGKAPTKADKAAAATLNARRAAEARKATLKRRLKTLVAKRKKATERLEALRNTRNDRKTERDTRRNARDKRLAKKPK